MDAYGNAGSKTVSCEDYLRGHTRILDVAVLVECRMTALTEGLSHII